MINLNDFVEHFASFYDNNKVLFKGNKKHSWTLAITSFFYSYGKQNNKEVRCGNLYNKIIEIYLENNINPVQNELLTNSWNNDGNPIHGLLDTDISWVSKNFSIPRDFSIFCIPDNMSINLIVEHEDEATIYTDGSGTNLIVILDEVRKISNVKSDTKILSFITSKSEVTNGIQLNEILTEIKRNSDYKKLTKQLIILQFAKYLRPNSKKEKINNGQTLFHLYVTEIRIDDNKCFNLDKEFLL